MSVSPGSLSDVREELADNLEDQLTEDEREQLRRAIPDSVIEEYESAGETTDEQQALIEAAADGIDSAYINYYDQRPSIREKLRDAAQTAFGESDREAISNLAKEVNLDDVYALCSRGEFSKVADMANLDSSNFDSVNECKNAAANGTNYSERLFNAYREEDDNSSFREKEYNN